MFEFDDEVETFDMEFEETHEVGGGDGIAIELPREWREINEQFADPEHRIIGGLLYKDFDGNWQVTPLAPPYGIREDECGVAMNALVMYNSKQQMLCKPPTDPRHTVNLGYLSDILAQIFGTKDNRNFIVSDEKNPNKIESGLNNALLGKNSTIKSGVCNLSSASAAEIQGDCNGVFGWLLNVVGDMNEVGGYNHQLGDASKGYKVHYSRIGGQGHKVGKEKTVRYCDVSGIGHEINHEYVDASGSSHKSSRDYQVLRGYGAKADSGAALILALGQNIFTVGASGTRENVGTDAVTVDFLKKYVANAIASIPNAEEASF